MLNKKRKSAYFFIGTALGLVAGIYQMTIKEILRNDVNQNPSRDLDPVEEKISKTEKTGKTERH